MFSGIMSPRYIEPVSDPYLRNGNWSVRIFGQRKALSKYGLKIQSRQAAKEKCAELRQKYKAGELVEYQKPIYLHDAIERYVSDREKSYLKGNLARSTWDGIKVALVTYMKRFFSSNPPYMNLTHQNLIDLKFFIQEGIPFGKRKGNGKNSVNQKIRYINTFLSSLEWGIKKPPHKGVQKTNEAWKQSKSTRRKIEKLSDKDNEKILKYSRFRTDEWRFILPIQVITGLPKREIRSELIFTEEYIELTRIKTETPFRIPISKKLREYIPELIGKGRIVLYPHCNRYFSTEQGKIMKELNLSQITPHMFKHNFVTWGLEHGASWEVLSKCTGTSVKTLMAVYGQYEYSKEAVKLMEAR